MNFATNTSLNPPPYVVWKAPAEAKPVALESAVPVTYALPAASTVIPRGKVVPAVPRKVEYTRADAPEAFVFSFVKNPVVAGDDEKALAVRGKPIPVVPAT